MTRRWLATALTVLVALGTASVAGGAAWAAPVSVTPINNPVVALPQASSASLLRYESTSIRGERITLTASLLLPKGKAPQGGWPLTVWNHMTTGGADGCAPTKARPGSTTLADMTSGDMIVGRLLDAGIAVVRPDYEGLGSPGPHPYLIGKSLARSVIDAAHAAITVEPRIGHDVSVAGHSEGAVAALFAGAAPRAEWGDLRLRSVSAVTPPTRMADLVDGIARVPVAAGKATGELMGLAALIISGAAAAHPDFARMVAAGGLSPRATAMLPLVEKLCYRDLSGPRAFGALAPTELLGPHGDRAKARLLAIVNANDVAHLRLPHDVPVRIDSGVYDAVAPAPFLDHLASLYRARNVVVNTASHLAGHSEVPRNPAAAKAIADWIARTLVAG